MSTVRNYCDQCNKQKAVSICIGCSQKLCYNDNENHRQELRQQLYSISTDCDQFRATLNEQARESKRHSVIQQIDEWEVSSINKITQIADETRQRLLSYMDGHTSRIKFELKNLTKQLKHSEEENDFLETDLTEWKQNLTQLKRMFNEPCDIKISYDSTQLIPRIYVDILAQLFIPKIPVDTIWMANSITVAGDNKDGKELNQLYRPCGIYVDDDRTIYVADTYNHRIVEWRYGKTSGRIVAGGNGPGKEDNQLNSPYNVVLETKNDCLIISDSLNRRVIRWPRQNGTNGETIISNINCRGLAMDNYGNLYVSNVGEHEVRRFETGDTNGSVVAGGNGSGSSLRQLNCPYYIFVDQDQSVFVSDYGNHRVVKWLKDAREGIVVAGDKGDGNGMNQLSYPRGIIVDQLGTVYVVDKNNCRVMRWLQGATEGSVAVDGNRLQGQTNDLSNPGHLFFDRHNHLYVVDESRHRVQKFITES